MSTELGGKPVGVELATSPSHVMSRYVVRHTHIHLRRNPTPKQGASRGSQTVGRHVQGRGACRLSAPHPSALRLNVTPLGCVLIIMPFFTVFVNIYACCDGFSRLRGRRFSAWACGTQILSRYFEVMSTLVRDFPFKGCFEMRITVHLYFIRIPSRLIGLFSQSIFYR